MDMIMKKLIKLILLSALAANATVLAKPFVLDIKTQIKFDGTALFGPVTHTQIQKLALAKIDGGGQFPHGFKGSLDTHVVHNCQEYWRYGLHPNNTYEISMASFFVKNCGILSALLHAKKPEKSYLQGVSLANPKLLSPGLLPAVVKNDDIVAYQKQNLSIADLIQMGKVKFESHSPYEITITYNGLKEIIDEVARADFNGDGLDAILVSIGTYSTEGSYRTYEISTITRTNQRELLHIVPLVKKS